jgi:predicted O-linked N-acetylglucosamine transferase (SPINDLY family)
LSRHEALKLLQEGKPKAAAASLEAWLREHPSDAQGWFLRGACHHVLKELREAADAFSRSLSLDPANPEAHLAHVAVLREMCEPRAALAAIQAALRHLPEDPRIAYASAVCHEDVGDDQQALAEYDRALRTSPPHADALHNRGLLLARLGRLEEAETNQRRFVDAHPGEVRAHSGLADVLLARARNAEALACLEKVLQLDPANFSAFLRKGVALAALQRFDESRAIFARAQAARPHEVEQYLARIAPGADPAYMLSPENLFFWQSYLALQRCDWSPWEACVEQMKALPGRPQALVEPAVAFISFHLQLTGAERLAVARHIAKDFHARAPKMPPLEGKRAAPIRLGILSPDLREHLNAYLLLPFFELADRSRFELFTYSLAADDGSAIRARVAAAAGTFKDLHGVSDDDAAARIRNDDLDILLDVGGHTTGARFGIVARRPARIQAAYLGFAGSLGSSRVDYAITDAIAGGDPEEWSEERVFLPHTYYLYDFRAPVPQIALTRRDYGLPENAFVFCAFHKAEKISPDAFALWMRILQRVPGAVLWLLALSDAAQQNLRREAARLGVDPARMIFAPYDPRDRYLARQRLGDLMLDAIHHSAMTTACDAMAAGLPVLTLRGSAMASRAGESLARAAGVPDLVALDAEEYVEKAVRLASGSDQLAGYRRVLLERKGPLFDTAGRVRELEAALQEMWDRYQRRA